MFTLPPLPPTEQIVDIRPIDFEIQAPNTDADVLKALVSELFGIVLNSEHRLLSIHPNFPDSWKTEDLSLSTKDFDFTVSWKEEACTWSFESFGPYAERYDSIIVYAPVGTLFEGELSDTDETRIVYINTTEPEEKANTETHKLTRKERKELKKQKKNNRKRGKK
ncbi:MAG: hypothetical protein Q4B58_03240 [Bacteroidales bacterium]|nr:hypothetical protein [Bacteroidales bacterium]